MNGTIVSFQMQISSWVGGVYLRYSYFHSMHFIRTINFTLKSISFLILFPQSLMPPSLTHSLQVLTIQQLCCARFLLFFPFCASTKPFIVTAGMISFLSRREQVMEQQNSILIIIAVNSNSACWDRKTQVKLASRIIGGHCRNPQQNSSGLALSSAVNRVKSLLMEEWSE